MKSGDVIRALQQATEMILLFNEQRHEELSDSEERLDIEEFDRALSGLVSTALTLLPVGTPCPCCKGSGKAGKRLKKRRPN